MADFISAGRLDRLVRVLELRQTPEGWAWAERRKAWAMVEGESGRSLFSSIGLGARAYKLTLRRQGLTLHNAILWEGRHLFLTQIDPLGRGHLEVRSAAVQVTQCVAGPGHPAQGKQFPGVVTEKYIRHEQGEPYATNAVCYVLVTPKAVELTPGYLVRASVPVALPLPPDGLEEYHVLTAHTLDEYKNEYEIMRTRDIS